MKFFTTLLIPVAYHSLLPDLEYNLTDSDGSIGTLATRLFGWEGCGGWGSSKRKAIYSGWQQSWQLMDAVKGKNLDFNDAAALGYLSPPFENEQEQAAIKKVFETVETIRGGSSLNPFKWWLHVRCDDPSLECTCRPSNTVAYASNRDRKSGYARINFCPRYFEQQDLGQAIRDNSKKELPVTHRADLTKYVKNKGRTWFHELLHIDWASGVNPAYHITDLYAMFTYDDTLAKIKIYGPAITKGLAKREDAAWWLKRNSDSFTMYAMAKTVQKVTGMYPHLPLAAALGGVDDNPTLGPELFITDDFIIDRQGKATIIGPIDRGKCQQPDDEDTPADSSIVVPFNSSALFMGRSYYPEHYNRQLRGWLADAHPNKNRVRMVIMQTSAGPQ